ncbi:eco47IIM, partial [Symbiodinium pilosum]
MLNLWRGQGCGSACLKFHAGIDEAPDTVIHEVWARKFQQENGNKATMSEATAFQVFLRIPASALDALQQTTASGVYVEPREPGLATGPSPEYAVIWLPGMDYQAAQHCKRKTDKALALTRIGHKYGVRVHSKDEEVAFRALRPEHVFSRVKVVEKYRLHPLPHGLTRQGLQQLLDAWQWAAKPLQPSKGDAAGAAWDVGAECPPPSAALSTCLGFVLPVQISSPDPWANGQDPWAKFKQSNGDAPKVSASATAKIQEVHAQLRQEVDEAVQSSLAEREQLDGATESRFQQLETSLTELRTQGQKFESWFAEAGKRMDQTALEVGALKTTMQGQQYELSQLQGQVAVQGKMVQNTVSQADYRE